MSGTEMFNVGECSRGILLKSFNIIIILDRNTLYKEHETHLAQNTLKRFRVTNIVHFIRTELSNITLEIYQL